MDGRLTDDVEVNSDAGLDLAIRLTLVIAGVLVADLGDFQAPNAFLVVPHLNE